jgi:hypothetical protein
MEDRFQPETEPEEAPPSEDLFETPEVAYGWGQPPIAPRPVEPPATPTFRQIQPLPMPEHEPAVANEPQPLAPGQAPAPVVDIRLREQSTSSDVRADRLVRQVRNEVQQLRQSFEALSSAPDEMLELDVKALVADPEHAVTLPPSVLVRAVVQAAEEIETLRSQVGAEQEKRLKVQRRLRQTRQLEAARQARLDTLEQVIEALHANLEDLRLERDRTRLPAQQPAALRQGPHQLPQTGGIVSECD